MLGCGDISAQRESCSTSAPVLVNSLHWHSLASFNLQERVKAKDLDNCIRLLAEKLAHVIGSADPQKYLELHTVAIDPQAATAIKHRFFL